MILPTCISLRMEMSRSLFSPGLRQMVKLSFRYGFLISSICPWLCTLPLWTIAILLQGPFQKKKVVRSDHYSDTLLIYLPQKIHDIFLQSIGSKSAVGSSKTRIFGLWMRPQAISSRFCIPPERYSASLLRCSSKPVASNSSLDVVGDGFPRQSVQLSEMQKILFYCQLRIKRIVPRRVADAVFDLMQIFIQVFRYPDRFEEMHRLSCTGLQKTGDQVEQGGLSASGSTIMPRISPSSMDIFTSSKTRFLPKLLLTSFNSSNFT